LSDRQDRRPQVFLARSTAAAGIWPASRNKGVNLDAIGREGRIRVSSLSVPAEDLQRWSTGMA